MGRPRPLQIKWHEFDCPVCNEHLRLTATQALGGKRRTCGRPECAAEHRRRIQAKTNESIRAAFLDHTRHRRTKNWYLVGPDGTRHQCRNLEQWVRENPTLFNPEDVDPGTTYHRRRAATILTRLRPERKNPVKSWKGWKWDYEGQASATVGRRVPPDMHERIREMSSQGVSQKKVLKALGCSRYTIRKALNPDFAEAERKRQRAIDRSIKRVNDPAYKAYQATWYKLSDHKGKSRARMAAARQARKEDAPRRTEP
jgi:hypothetical protein